LLLSRAQGVWDPDIVLRGAIAGVLAIMLGAGLGYALLGVNFLDHLQLFPPCPIRAVTGVRCPGCGMTRAFLLLSQLRLGDAVAANPLAPFLALAMLWRLVRPQRSDPAQRRFGNTTLVSRTSWPSKTPSTT
jgi:hypothetical protein